MLSNFYLIMRDRVRHWTTVDHHLAHATYAFYDSPFNHGLIVSMDGGGNDGVFNVYAAERSLGLDLRKKHGSNLGAAYEILATFVPEVSKQTLCEVIGLGLGLGLG